MGLSYSLRHSNAKLSYNFTYRETSLLKSPKKTDLTKTSLLVVLVHREKEIKNLKLILE